MNAKSDSYRAGFLAAGTIVVALALSAFSIDLGAHAGPTSVAVAGKGILEPWHESWQNVPATTVRVSTPLGEPIRLAKIRSKQTPDGLQVLVEWPDQSPDMSFEGSDYARALKSDLPKVQESTLLRDEIHVWLGKGPLERGRRTLGVWNWKSQWQQFVDDKARAKAPQSPNKRYTDFYPQTDEGAYAARYTANPNAIVDPQSSVEWMVNEKSSVYGLSQRLPMEGIGRWQNGYWRVIFQVPTDVAQTLDRKVHATLRVVDGYLGERPNTPGVSEPFELDTKISVLKENL